MSASDHVRRALVDGWLQLAELDFSLATELLEGGSRHPLAIAFHSQQAAEKYLKALLVERQVEFPKTHDLGRLIQLVERADPGVAERLVQIEALSPYAVEGRYPGDTSIPTREEAAEAVRLARLAREEVLRALKRG